MKTSACIQAISFYVPEKVETNEDLQQQFGGKISEIVLKKVGVKKRHIATVGEPGSLLALKAAEKLFEEHSIRPEEIDALIYCSPHHDYITPSTSGVLQYKLGLSKTIATYDLTFACSGYIYSLSLARSIIEALGFKRVLVLTSNIISKYINPKDQASRVIFGDAGSATLIVAEENIDKGIKDFVFGTDGSGFEKIIIRHGADFKSVDEDSLKEKNDEYGNVYSDANFYMDGPAILTFTMKTIPQLIEDTLKKNQLTKDDIDLFVLHQANDFMNEQVRKIAGIEKEKFYSHIENYGNTVQATIPIALKAAMAEGKIKSGSKVFVAGFGTGLSWCATVINF